MAKKASSPKPGGSYKSADTGKFVKPKYAQTHPKTTYKLGGKKG